jgi:hypothetical protein
MKYRDPKLVMADADGSGNLEKLDVHICNECRSDVVDFANGKTVDGEIKNQQLRAIEKINLGIPLLAERTLTAEKKYPTMKQLIKDSKKKHPFYGNQHKKVVRK